MIHDDSLNIFGLRLAASAIADIEDIRSRSLNEFGQAAWARYRALLLRAFQDIATNPLLPGSISRVDIRPGLRCYPLALARKRAAPPGERVGRPRHVAFYLVLTEKHEVELLRILFESMDPALHLGENTETD